MKKKPTDVQDSDNCTEILQKAIVSFKECGETKSSEQQTQYTSTEILYFMQNTCLYYFSSSKKVSNTVFFSINIMTIQVALIGH